MGWISTLSETYDNAVDHVGQIDSDGLILLPVSHSTQNAQIEVDIDVDGIFKNARKVDKIDAVTIIPVTEDSGTRSSGIAPHPLCDKLCYIAKDYTNYVSKKDMTKYFETYINNLEEWVESEFTHKKVVAIWKFLKKGELIHDLIKYNILEPDENGILSEKTNKMQTTIAQTEAFVRFRVLEFGERHYFPETWKDQNLFTSYIKFYENKKIDLDLCYITGKQASCSDKHPAKIRNSGDKAKLISGNDSMGFTYRGRFKEKAQAVSVGYVTSQKAHNALRWLIQKQGYTKDGTTIVAWNTTNNNNKIPDIFSDTDALLEEIPQKYNTGASYADRLNSSLTGYYEDLTSHSTISVIGLDAATTGRLSITFYRQIEGSAFLKRINSWHKHCSWTHHYKKKDEKYYTFTGAPTPREIALTAFGNDQNGLLKAKDTLIKSTVERLLPCIIDGRKLPFDIVKAAVNHAGRPMAMSGYNWQRVLSNTCALIKKYNFDKSGKEDWDMALKKDCNDRSYLFGRLLAVADKVEYRTFEKGENRETNAKRFWDIYTVKPAKTWDILYRKLLPYFSKIKSISEKTKYENLITEIGAIFKDEDFNNSALSEKYLLGYWSQTEELKYKNEKTEEMEEITND